MRISTLGRWLGVLALAAMTAAPSLAQRTVTLRMNSATMPDTVAAGPAADVQVRGGLASGTALPGGGTIDWSDNTTVRPTNVGGDYWEVEFDIPDNDRLEFKFFIGQSEGDGLPGGYEEGGNHVIEAGTDDVALDLHYFEKVAGDQAYDWRPFAAAGDSIAVWFRVYVDTQDAGTRGLDIGDGGLMVGARGNFGTLGAEDADGPLVDWGEGGDTDAGVRLTRESADPARPGYSLFSGVAKYPASAAGMDAVYKFYFYDSNTTGDGGYEGADNRTFTVPTASSDTTLHWVFFSNSPANTGSLVTSNVAFQVDVSPLTTIGLFQTSDDIVQIRGGFNGWDCPEANQDDCLLQQDAGTADYLRQIPIRSAPDSELEYKFYVDFRDAEGNAQFQDGSGNDLDVGWEEPLDTGGGNRTFTFTGAETQTVDEQFFNSVRPGNVIPDGQSIALTFQADMNAAKSFTDSQGRAFDPAKDTVTVQFEDNVWLLTQGYTIGGDDLTEGANGQLIDGFKLTDPDGDGVYTGTLTVTGPSYNGIGYRLAFANDDDGIQVEGTGNIGSEGRRRYRYITDTSADAFTFAMDTYRPTDTNTPRLSNLPWEINPTGPFTPDDFSYAVPNGYVDQGNAVSVTPRPVGGATLALGNVRPNPTMGLARFEVAAAPGALVTVRVYDVTGRVVATVVEDGAVAGRTLQLDTAGLAAGLYLVRADSGAEVATARFTVVR